MAVSRAQNSVGTLVDMLRKMGKDCKFCIHAVAGRLPGHMNVLLAEADVPYDIVHESDHVNRDFPQTDVVLIIGANDIVNPDAYIKIKIIYILIINKFFFIKKKYLYFFFYFFFFLIFLL